MIGPLGGFYKSFTPGDLRNEIIAILKTLMHISESMDTQLCSFSNCKTDRCLKAEALVTLTDNVTWCTNLLL